MDTEKQEKTEVQNKNESIYRELMNVPYRIGIIRVSGGWKTLTNEGKTK